jgi:SAM-dependent methyltransferase
LFNYEQFFDIDVSDKNVLEIGCGKCKATREIQKLAKDLWVVDIAPTALARAAKIVGEEKAIHVDCAPYDLPFRHFHMVISYVVVQHLSDVEVAHQIRYALRALRGDGRYYVQFLTKDGLHGLMTRGASISRHPELFARMIEDNGGEVVRQVEPIKGTLKVYWNGFVVRRRQ